MLKSHSLVAQEELLAQLGNIERQISELEGERKAVQRLLTKLRQQNLENHDVTRRDSFDRLLVEKQILDTLRGRSRETSTADLFRQARSVNYGLKDATFRSHLHRMKKKGTITSPKWGFWRIVKGQ